MYIPFKIIIDTGMIGFKEPKKALLKIRCHHCVFPFEENKIMDGLAVVKVNSTGTEITCTIKAIIENIEKIKLGVSQQSTFG